MIPIRQTRFPYLIYLLLNLGHRWVKHPNILLSHPSQRALRRRVHRESQLPDRPDLRRGLRRHRYHVLLR